MLNFTKQILTTIAALTLFSCGSWVGNPQTGQGDEPKGARVSFELASAAKPVITDANSAALRATDSTFFAHHEVTLKTYSLPVRRIYLFGEDGLESNVYQCVPTDTEDCRVNLAAAPLQNLLPNLGEVSVAAASYQGVGIEFTENCSEDSAAPLILEAEATLDDIVYYSNTDSQLSTTGPSSPVVLPPISQCLKNLFQSPIEIAADTSLGLHAFFDLQNLATIEQGRGIGNGCATNGTQSICIMTPTIATTLSEAPPIIERYLLSSPMFNSVGCHGMAGFIFDENGDVFGGFLRSSFFREQDCGGSSLGGGGNLVISVNEDGSLNWRDGGSDASSTYNTYPSFSRGSHSGKATIKLGDSSSDIEYEAVLIAE